MAASLAPIAARWRQFGHFGAISARGGARWQRVETLLYLGPRLEGCRTAGIDAADRGQNHVCLGGRQLANVRGYDPAPRIREDRERKTDHLDAERGGGVQGLLLTDQQRIADLHFV